MLDESAESKGRTRSLLVSRCNLAGVRLAAIALMTAFIAASGFGCASLTDPNVPEPIRAGKDPALQREYLLYRPSAYTPQRSWPLIVACHGGFLDSPNAEIRDWNQLAERYGFLVLAPKLTAGGKPGDKLRDDEAHLLSAIQHVRAGHSVSDDRILMYARGTGALVALKLAFAQPDLFRAVAVTDPRLAAEDLAAMRVTIDPYQPIYLRYNPNDAIIGNKARQCVDWLRANTPSLRVDTFGTSREANAQRIVEFFQDAIRNEPWLHIRAIPAGSEDPLIVQFKIRSSFTPDAVHWRFGDGDESTQNEPTHRYRKPGAYQVRLTVDPHKRDPFVRVVTLRVPELTVAIAQHGASETP